MKQSQSVHRQNPTPDVTKVFGGEFTTFNLLGMAPPAMLLLLAVEEVQVVVFEVDSERVLEVLQVEVLAELEVGLESLKVLLPIVNLLLLPTELPSPVDIFAVTPVLLVVEWLKVVDVVLMLAELGLSPILFAPSMSLCNCKHFE